MLVFFDLSPLEIVVLLGLSVVLFGPDRLPAAAMSAARLLRQIRALAESSRTQVREQLGPEFAELGLGELGRDLRSAVNEPVSPPENPAEADQSDTASAAKT